MQVLYFLIFFIYQVISSKKLKISTCGLYSEGLSVSHKGLVEGEFGFEPKFIKLANDIVATGDYSYFRDSGLKFYTICDFDKFYNRFNLQDALRGIEDWEDLERKFTLKVNGVSTKYVIASKIRLRGKEVDDVMFVGKITKVEACKEEEENQSENVFLGSFRMNEYDNVRYKELAATNKTIDDPEYENCIKSVNKLIKNENLEDTKKKVSKLKNEFEGHVRKYQGILLRNRFYHANDEDKSLRMVSFVKQETNVPNPIASMIFMTNEKTGYIEVHKSLCFEMNDMPQDFSFDNYDIHLYDSNKKKLLRADARIFMFGNKFVIRIESLKHYRAKTIELKSKKEDVEVITEDLSPYLASSN